MIKGPVISDIIPKVYIGQTIHDDPYKRWKSHLKDLKSFENGKKKSSSRILYSSIIKYGLDKFEFIPLVCCEKEQLNTLEILFGEVIFKSLCPNGFNIRHCGGGKGKLSEETKKLISERTKEKMQHIDLKKLEKSKGLRKYLSYRNKFIKGTEYEGYRISNHPLCGNQEFLEKKPANLDNLLVRSNKFIDDLEEKNVPYKAVRKNDRLPTNIYKTKNGYKSIITFGKKSHTKSFNDKTLNDEDKLNLAIKWLEEIKKQKDMCSETKY